MKTADPKGPLQAPEFVRITYDSFKRLSLLAEKGKLYEDQESSNLFEFEVEVEGIFSSVRYPVFPELQSRAQFFFSSQVFVNTFQEYLDNPQSAQDIGEMFLLLAKKMRGEK